MSVEPMLTDVEFDVVRVALRRAREASRTSRAALEERSGVTEGTIWKIETGWTDPRSGKPYMPSAEQFLRLVVALPDITVSQFFAQIEGLPAPVEVDKNQTSLKGGADGGSPSVSASPDTIAIMGGIRAIVGAINKQTDRLSPPREQAASPRPRRPRRPASDRRHRG